jgi:hypothetical protein
LYGDAVCVVPSRWTTEQVTSVRAQVDQLFATGMIYQGGTTSSADGRALVHARAVRASSELVNWGNPIPEGLLHVASWLRLTA